MTLGYRNLRKVNSPKSPKLANTSLRKKALIRTLSNGVQFGMASKANLKVVVRVRPDNQREIDSNARSVVDLVDDHMLIFDPDKDEEDFFFKGTKQKHRDLNKRPHKEQKFVFERIFGLASTNNEIFETTTRDIVTTILEGYNCSVFAYGATGSGKTHTMIGSEHNPGITFLTVMELYNEIAKLPEGRTCEVGVSYLEVYNETVRDLLNPTSPPLNLRETGHQVQVTGLSLHKPSNAADLLRILADGNLNRSQHPTDANAESSRSHAVFQVFVRQQDRASDIKSSVSIAKLSMIDLAGSERGAVTGFRGARFREGANINKSLLALGNCINALADGKGHIPYRDSKLTRLLKDSIGGNCRSVMIATISRMSLSFEDTFNTLRYANRAKTIKMTLKKNLMNVDQHVSQYVKIVEDLKSEISVLKERLSACNSDPVKHPDDPSLPVLTLEEKTMYEETIQSLKLQLEERRSSEEEQTGLQKEFLEALMDLNCQYKNLQKEILQLETKERELEIKSSLYLTNIVRMKVFSFASAKLDKGISKCERSIQSFRSHLSHIQGRKITLASSLSETKSRLMDLCNRLRKDNDLKSDRSAQFLIDKLKQNELEQKLRNENQINKYLREVILLLVGDQVKTEKLLVLLLAALKHAYLRQKVAKDLDSDTEDFLEKVYAMLDASRVEWADLKGTSDSLQDQVGPQNSLLQNVEKLVHFPGVPSIDFSPVVFDMSHMYKRSSMKSFPSSADTQVREVPNDPLSSHLGTPEGRVIKSRRILDLCAAPLEIAEDTLLECSSPGPSDGDNETAAFTKELKNSKLTAFCGATPPRTAFGSHHSNSFEECPLPGGTPSSPGPPQVSSLNSTIPVDSGSPLKVPSPIKEAHSSPLEGTYFSPAPGDNCIQGVFNQTITLSSNGGHISHSPSPPRPSKGGSLLVHDVANSTFSMGIPEAMQTFIVSPEECEDRINSKVVLQPLPISAVRNKENVLSYKMVSKKCGLGLTSAKYSSSKLAPTTPRRGFSHGMSRSISTSCLPAKAPTPKGTLKKSISFLKPRFEKNQENVAPKTAFGSKIPPTLKRDGTTKKTTTLLSSAPGER